MEKEMISFNNQTIRFFWKSEIKEVISLVNHKKRLKMEYTLDLNVSKNKLFCIATFKINELYFLLVYNLCTNNQHIHD
jgi:hypothetical protein